MKVKKAFEYLLIALILMTFTSCSSSGGGIGGSGASKPVVSKGTITEKGSIFVNGVEFETTGAAITTDDDSGKTQDDLDLGMVVTVRGFVNADGITGTAVSIEFEDNLEGPITVDSDGAQTITVLGQTVKWDISTTRCVDKDDNKIDCADLAVGNKVEVSGFPRGPNTILATRIERKKLIFEFNKDDVELKGTISELNLMGKTFKIGSQIVDFTAQTELPDGGLANGMFVEVKGNLESLDPSAALNAKKVELEEEGLDVQEGFEVHVEGLVDSEQAPNLVILGVTVQTNSGTEFEDANGNPITQDEFFAQVQLGTHVEAKGTFDGTAIIADKVKIED